MCIRDSYDIDGHDMQQILDAFNKIRAAKNGKPKFINAKTVKGKGVDLSLIHIFAVLYSKNTRAIRHRHFFQIR